MEMLLAGCDGLWLCFSERAGSWQLVFIHPHAKITVSLNKQTNPRCLKKGNGVTVENLAVCQ